MRQSEIGYFTIDHISIDLPKKIIYYIISILFTVRCFKLGQQVEAFINEMFILIVN